MIRTFTPVDVVRYIYGETSEEENTELLSAMLFDEQLANTYASLSETVSSLDLVAKEPSEKSIDNILSYSKSFHMHSV